MNYEWHIGNPIWHMGGSVLYGNSESNSMTHPTPNEPVELEQIVDGLVNDTSAYIRGEPIAFNVKKAEAITALTTLIDKEVQRKVKAAIPEKYDLSGIDDAYVEHPYEWGFNSAVNEFNTNLKTLVEGTE